MRTSLTFCAIFLSFLLTTCSRENARNLINVKITKTDDGVIVPVHCSDQGARFVRLQVIDDQIIRVTATPADSFSTERSLMLLPGQPQKNITWSLLESDTSIIVSTRSVKARLLRATGEIVFTDAKGIVLLEEQKNGGKSFTPTIADRKPYYSIQQKFLSPPDEECYGLGGHQNGQMNYKNDDGELIQANIADVVPFVISSKNYGLL
jgi:alpha-D-xyloside xylohydrolase